MLSYVLAGLLAFSVVVYAWERRDRARTADIDQAVLLAEISGKLDRCLTLLTATVARQNELEARVQTLEVKVQMLEAS